MRLSRFAPEVHRIEEGFEPMNVLLTFDVEVWCNGWADLDAKFSNAFKRYIFGSSAKGDFGLPRILSTLERYGIRAVFFVEPLFAGRFGLEYLAAIVNLLKEAQQEVQLHLHPEWTDEINPYPLPCRPVKRQHLHQYTLEEQTKLIRYGVDALRQVGVHTVSAFRAGSFAANGNTFAALKANGLQYDSSVNATFQISVPDLRTSIELYCESCINGVTEYPIGIFRDGFGRARHAQIGACSLRELVSAIENAEALEWRQFVLLAHNFELLKPGSADPDLVVVKRFDGLCQYLGRRASSLLTKDSFTSSLKTAASRTSTPTLPRVPVQATSLRFVEQFRRRASNLAANGKKTDRLLPV